ncbi:MAG: hypothetical protein H6993_01020 [Pseudomonadales bacterium]|nr:hypothetical protein [Pseudomonadales bacterium]
MSDAQARARIQRMVVNGTISGVEAEGLLAALGDASPAWRRLSNPFASLSQRYLVLFAVVVTVLGFVTSFLGVRFDGAMDMHLPRQTVAPLDAFRDIGVSILTTAMVFWLFSLPFARQVRWVDYLVGVAAARLPLVVMALLLLPVRERIVNLAVNMPSGVLDVGAAALLALATLPCLAWLIWWLFFAVREASGLRGWRLAVVFVAGLVTAEVLSKSALVLFGPGT